MHCSVPLCIPAACLWGQGPALCPLPTVPALLAGDKPRQSQQDPLTSCMMRWGAWRGAPGDIQSRVLPSCRHSAPSLLLAMAWSLHARQGMVPHSRFSFPEARPLLGKTPLSQSGELWWGHGLPGTWQHPTDPPASLSLNRRPRFASPGRHGGLPWTAPANGGRCQPVCRARGRGWVGARSGVPHSRGALSHPSCQRGRVSLSFATGDGDGPSGCLLPPRRKKGVCPAGRRQRGQAGGEVGEVQIGPRTHLAQAVTAASTM